MESDTRLAQIVVAGLSIMFGMGTWITVNGIWVELPLLVDTLPERWNLASYLVIIIQLANIGPIIYGIARRRVQQQHILEHFTVHCILAVGAIASILLSVSWSNVLYIAGAERSLPLFVLVFFLALMDCTSSVVFLPFMSNYKEKYVAYFLTGSGLSGFVPSVVALIQGVGGNPECKNITQPNSTSKVPANHTTVPVYPPPQFPVGDFFYFIFSMMLASWIAFLLMNKLKIAYGEKIKTEHYQEATSTTYNDCTEAEAVYSEVPLNERTNIEPTNAEAKILQTPENSLSSLCHLLIIQGWSSVLSHGVFPAVQPFSCLPYGNQAYHLAVTLANMANPIACFVAVFIPLKSVVQLGLLSVISTLVACYVMATALLSPEPPLLGSFMGVLLVVVAWIVMFGFFSYIKANIAAILHVQGKQALFLCGAVTQVGSAFGALAIFLLINFTNLFQSYYPCSPQ